VDELEGFARAFMLAALRLHSRGGAHPPDALERYHAALDAGTRPGHPEAWPTIGHHDQSLVEATAIAVSLHWGRPWPWTLLPERIQGQVVRWLSSGRTSWCADNNHVLFGATVQAFLASVGADHDAAAIDGALNRIDEWYAGDGWYSDGTGRRFDHYNAWTFHLYPFIIEQLLAGLPPSCGGAVAAFDVYRSRLRMFLDDYQHLFDATGSPLIHGRSLIYRFGMAAPLWMGALQGASPLPPGRTRRLASGMLSGFVTAGTIDTGVLDLGWKRPAPDLLQSYNASGSPLWASKGFLGLLLPADHPVWTDTETSLEIEEHDVVRPLGGPRWVAVGRHGDGITRLLNHGSDGHPRVADKLYRRLAYSTATVPVDVDGLADNTVAVGPRGAPSIHRGLLAGTVRRHGAASRWRIDAQGRDVTVDVATVVLDDAEIRLARVCGAIEQPIRVSGWAVSSDQPIASTTGPHWVSATTAENLTSALRWLPTPGTTSASLHLESRHHPHALGDHVAVPWAQVQADESGQTQLAWLVRLGREQSSVAMDRISVTWAPDGAFVQADGQHHHCAWVREHPWRADELNQGVFRVGSAPSCR
jgi:hypothetical protein